MTEQQITIGAQAARWKRAGKMTQPGGKNAPGAIPKTGTG